MKTTVLRVAIACILTMGFLEGSAQNNNELLGENMALRYLVHAPAHVDKNTPTIILLHGVGSNEQDLFSLAGQLPADALIVSARAPLTLSKNSFAWYHLNASTGTPVINNGEAENARVLITDFIRQVVEKYHASADKVFLLGFSQGAIMSYSVALSHPEKVHGILALSGRILDEAKEHHAAKGNIKKVAIFIGHGTRDRVLPITHSQEANKYLQSLGLAPSYHEYKMEHEICADELNDIKAWFLKFK